LEALIRATPVLELLAPVPLNVVCFRYRGSGSHPGPALDALNGELLVRLQEEAVAIPSVASIRGSKAIRIAITNHRTRREDLDLLVREAVRIGGVLEAAGSGSPAGSKGVPATR